MLPAFGPLIQHQNMQFIKYPPGTLSAGENPLSILLWSSPVTMSCVTLDGEVQPWALILTLLRVELPKPAASAPVLPCKYLLLGDAASRTLGFLFYGVLLAVEGFLTFLVLLHKASPVSNGDFGIFAARCTWWAGECPAPCTGLVGAECSGCQLNLPPKKHPNSKTTKKPK